MLKSEGFQTLKNSKMSCNCDRNVLFFVVESRYTSQFLCYFDSAQARTLPVKNLDFYPAHLCLIVTGGLMSSLFFPENMAHSSNRKAEQFTQCF
jgi:hypothetical protein